MLFYVSGTFEPAGRSFPVDCALVQQSPPALCQVFPAEYSAIFDFAQCLWLHLVVNISESRGLFMEVDQCIHLDDGVFDQTQRPGQVFMLICAH